LNTLSGAERNAARGLGLQNVVEPLMPMLIMRPKQTFRTHGD